MTYPLMPGHFMTPPSLPSLSSPIPTVTNEQYPFPFSLLTREIRFFSYFDWSFSDPVKRKHHGYNQSQIGDESTSPSNEMSENYPEWELSGYLP